MVKRMAQEILGHFCLVYRAKEGIKGKISIGHYHGENLKRFLNAI
jgi:hypothetical protein